MVAVGMLLLALLGAEEPAELTCTIRGLAVNRSQADAPLAGAEVVLRVADQGELFPYASTTTDADGRFCFDGVPFDATVQYLPGVNHQGIHYPGRRLQLSSADREAIVQLVAHDTVETPSPLTVLRHDLDVSTETGLLRITETMLVSNPSDRTYVGVPMAGGAGVTFWLSLPKEFEKITFHKEALGRAFQIIDGRPVTTIPWTPGEREVKFTYILPLTERRYTLRRPIDWPCGDVTLRVSDQEAGTVSANLGPADSSDPRQIVFRHQGSPLPIGHTLRIELGQAPVSPLAYARPIAVGLLAAAVLTVTLFIGRPWRRWGRKGPRASSTVTKRPSRRPQVADRRPSRRRSAA